MRKTSFAVTLTAAVALFLPYIVSAEHHEDERKPLTEVWMVVPKKGMEAEFSAAVQDHMAFRVESGEERQWMGFRVALGQNVSVVQLRSCCFDWADRDAIADAPGGDERGDHWGDNVHQYVDHYHHYFEYNDWENSHWPDDGSVDGPFYGVTSWKWKMGAGPGPNEARKKLSQMALENGWGEAGNHWLWLSRIGGEPTIMVVNPASNYADMAPPEPSFYEFISEQMGSDEEASALFAEFGSGFASQDYTIWVYDEDLSTPSGD